MTVVNMPMGEGCEECCCNLEVSADAQCCDSDGTGCGTCSSGLFVTLSPSDCNGATSLTANSSQVRYYRIDPVHVPNKVLRATWPRTHGSFIFKRQRFSWTVGANTYSTGWLESRFAWVPWPYGTGSGTLLLEAEYWAGVLCFACNAPFTADLNCSGTVGRDADTFALLVNYACADPVTFKRPLEQWQVGRSTQLTVVSEVGNPSSPTFPPIVTTTCFGASILDAQDGSDLACGLFGFTEPYSCFGGDPVREWPSRIDGFVRLGISPSGGNINTEIIAGYGMRLDGFDSPSCVRSGFGRAGYWEGIKTGAGIAANCTAVRNWFQGSHTLSPVIGSGSGTVTIAI